MGTLAAAWCSKRQCNMASSNHTVLLTCTGQLCVEAVAKDLGEAPLVVVIAVRLCKGQGQAAAGRPGRRKPGGNGSRWG